MHKYVGFFSALTLICFAIGCEWDESGDDDSWDSSYNWVNFGGTYRLTAGYSVATVGSQKLGDGTGAKFSYSTTLANTPVVASSLTVTDGTQTISDPDGDSSMTGDGTGSINYETGALSVTFTLAPSNGSEIYASYKYTSLVGGSSVDSIVVDQVGDTLTFLDSNGVSYSGSITSISNGGGDMSGTTSGEVIANFSVTGTDSSTITGTLQGTYTAPEDTAFGTLSDRVIQGTHTTSGGTTSDVYGTAGSVPIEVSS